MVKYLWLFEPDTAVVIPFISAALFAFGGGGHKIIRRFGLPIFLFSSSLSMGGNLWLSLLAGIALIAPLSKGYGDQLKEDVGEGYYYPLLYLIGLFYGLSLLPLAWRFWHLFLPLIPAITFGGLAFSSQKADFPRWKWVEAWTGFSIGFVLLAIQK